MLVNTKKITRRFNKVKKALGVCDERLKKVYGLDDLKDEIKTMIELANNTDEAIGELKEDLRV